jgi:hypothetical protein
MTATAIQMQRQATALKRAAEIAQILAPLGEPLRLAIEEPHPDDAYLLSEAVASLAKTCLEQRGHIVELAERLAALEGKAAAKG